MKGSGLEDLEQQMHVLRNHLHALQKPKVNGDIHHCMPVEKLTCNGARLVSHVGSDRLEGEALITKRQQVFEEVACNRHSCLAEGASPRRAPKRVESTSLEAFRERLELTQRADLVGPKLAREPLDKAIQQGMGRNTISDLKVSGNSSRTCRICNKQFPSGRALGGHMRVHGPFFAPGSVSSKLSYGVPTANTSTQGRGTNGYEVFEEDSGTPSIVDVLDGAEMEEESPLQVARSAQVPSSDYGADKTLCLDRDNSYGAGEIDAGPAADSEEESDFNITERRLVSLITDNPHIAHANSVQTEKFDANTTARNSRLSKLRHNPKRSRWFAEQEFAFELTSMGDGQSSFPVGRRSVCSDCGKAFPSERALFGHLRCHRDRDRRSEEGTSEQRAEAMVRHRRKWRVLEADKPMESSEMVGSKRAEVMDIEELVYHREEAILVGDKVQDGCFSSGMMREDDDVVPARWPTAGRRSRRNVGASKVEPGMENRETSSSTPEGEPALTSETISLELGVEEQEIETPDCLIMLADAARKIEEETEILLSTEKHSCLRAHVERSKAHQMDVADYYPDDIGDEHEDTSSGHDRLVVGSTVKYECTTCKKSFTSHQALGGHRASHKKTKGCFARTGSSDASEDHSLEDELEVSYVQENKGVVMTKRKKRQQVQQVTFKGHECSICHRIFLTGQALGGHKRCHWTGEKPSETASVASTNKQLSLQSEGQSMVDGCNIDLNRPASVDEDADEVGFVGPTEMHSINGEVADRESEIEKRSNVDGSDLVLGTSALAGAVKDLLKEDTSSSLLPPPLTQSVKRESEARRRFDGIWGQHWPNNIGVTHTQLHRPVCTMQSLV